MRLRVVCVPQAGMGAWAFHGWQEHFRPEVEIFPVEIPGRNSRMTEPKPTTMGELVKNLFADLEACGTFNKPYVLLGHSLGAPTGDDVPSDSEELSKRLARRTLGALHPKAVDKLEPEFGVVQNGNRQQFKITFCCKVCGMKARSQVTGIDEHRTIKVNGAARACTARVAGAWTVASR